MDMPTLEWTSPLPSFPAPTPPPARGAAGPPQPTAFPVASHAGWPNAFSALPVAEDVFEKRPK
jgi:hypothetical protein